MTRLHSAAGKTNQELIRHYPSYSCTRPGTTLPLKKLKIRYKSTFLLPTLKLKKGKFLYYGGTMNKLWNDILAISQPLGQKSQK